MQIDDVMLSEAKHLLFRPDENKSGFFSPAKSAGLQNDNITTFFSSL
ncbi:MAG: hypothetical protein HYX72_07910 [Acidobacteria bacterium]|nr:hypothetical protein [Acidobacteriota bacterium]